MKWNFDYGQARIGDFRVVSERDPQNNRVVVRSVELHGETLEPTRRFWKSLFMRFGFSESVFRYFDHAEVFERVAAMAPSDQLRYCIERNPAGQAKLLSVSN